MQEPPIYKMNSNMLNDNDDALFIYYIKSYSGFYWS